MSISVVIPCYKVENHIENVISKLPAEIDHIIVVNDYSPDGTEKKLLDIQKTNSRMIYVKHDVNQGVGGAMITGFKKSLELGCEITIKMDGDDQMDASYIPELIRPIKDGRADFVKGNRFKNYRTIQKMPFIRRVGNLGLSFLTKAASGYWNIFDPTNGFFAISSDALKLVDFSKIHKRYFFESSFLIEMYHSEIVIKDIPMEAIYGDEISGLSVTKTLFEFPPKLFKAFVMRVLFKYFLYDFNIASLYMLTGIPLLVFGSWYGLANFIKYRALHVSAPTGTVIIPVLMITLGFQLLLSVIQFDLNNYPKK